MAPKTRHLSAPSADTAVPLAPTRGLSYSPASSCAHRPYDLSSGSLSSYRYYSIVPLRILTGGSGDALKSAKFRISHPSAGGKSWSEAGAVVTWSLLTPRAR
ncbi:hypothetical protein M419DRAFT_8555 [Trichoderma reesei RUT C-30]|uniref:Uncharacterized protein n=1 Tax=Hypocrea jecorina (strain ATCC 56765 / BCRC 32924 / NRRL 11460 / Rut C-30) TaxID=1344414 RepID=A0A024SA20_HYPJR|nr:hypothetical protein M419DRAFT_8555 [Trichoderma reesei RUT C-30]